jgi:hypothetical protein
VRRSSGALGERNAVTMGTHADADEAIRRWQNTERAKRVERRHRQHLVPDPAASEPSSRFTALVRAPEAGALAMVPLSSISRTPLEDYRQKHGLDRFRKRIFERLMAEASLEKGLAKLDRWTMARLDRPCTSVADARELFPNVTLTEISMLGLLKRAPRTILYIGTGFDTAEVFNQRRSPEKRRLDPQDFCGTPMQLEFRPDGIAYGSDHTKFSGEESCEVNPRDREIMAFRESVREDIAQLVVLMIDRARLFELLRASSTDALVVGVGRIRQAALSIVTLEAEKEGVPATGSKKHSLKVRSIADDLAELSADLKTLYQQTEQEVAQKILGAKLRFDDGSRMAPNEIVHMLGMLRDIPSCLLQQKPFDGKILFDGAQFLFADNNDSIVEVAPLEGQCLDSVRHSILDEQTRSSETNRTLSAIQEELTARVQGVLFKDFTAQGSSEQNPKLLASPIEEIALRLLREYGVGVWGLAHREIRGVTATAEAPEKGGHISGGPVALVTLKLSLPEMQQVATVIDRFGPKLLDRIKTIQKTQTTIFANGAAEEGHTCSVAFRPETSTIHIAEYEELPFSDMRPAARTERAFLLAHAVGCSLWREVDDKAFWGRIRHAPGMTLSNQEGPDRSNFIHSIGLRNTQSDFAACVAAYVLARADFAKLAAGNPVLKLKFDSVQNFLAGKLPPGTDATPGNGSTARTPATTSDSTSAIALSEAVLGLRAQFPNAPDINDPVAVKKFFDKLDGRVEAAPVVLSAREQATMGTGVASIADYEREKERLALRQQILVVVEGCFGEIKKKLRGELTDCVLSAIRENEDLKETIAEFARKNPKLADLVSDPDDYDSTEDDLVAEVLIDALVDEGIVNK